jgi:hypothetical protein
MRLSKKSSFRPALLTVIMSMMVLYYLMEGFGYAALGLPALAAHWDRSSSAFSGISS